MWQDGQGVARRSRDGKEQAAEKGYEDATPKRFLHAQAPPCRLRLPSVSLRLGHARGLAVPRTVIQDPRAPALPPGGGRELPHLRPAVPEPPWLPRARKYKKRARGSSLFVLWVTDSPHSGKRCACGCHRLPDISRRSPCRSWDKHHQTNRRNRRRRSGPSSPKGRRCTRCPSG